MPASQAGRRRFESGRPLQIAARNGSPLRAIFSLPEVLMARHLIALLALALLTWFPTPVGSGVLISPDGKVMTAAHVVHTADEISVEFLSGEAVGARVVASEPQADVSLLQLERVPPGALAAKLGDSDKVQVGDQIFIIGAPYGIGHTLSVGHISARHKPNTVFKIGTAHV